MDKNVELKGLLYESEVNGLLDYYISEEKIYDATGPTWSTIFKAALAGGSIAAAFL